ncbi:hypothetical protein N7G274_008180 [Stereocaulon virgatum]|uniref:Uncharacterized protein n=1 Tax=Stereocaulon virgatum TaxID=373712 RepID=A0ABR4A1I3_9LECA
MRLIPKQNGITQTNVMRRAPVTDDYYQRSPEQFSSGMDSEYHYYKDVETASRIYSIECRQAVVRNKYDRGLPAMMERWVKYSQEALYERTAFLQRHLTCGPVQKVRDSTIKSRDIGRIVLYRRT